MAEYRPQLAGAHGLRLDDAASATSMAAFDGAPYAAQCMCSACAAVHVRAHVSVTLVPPQPPPLPLPDPHPQLWACPGAVIAPMMGCDSATDYYTQASSGPLLTRARVTAAC